MSSNAIITQYSRHYSAILMQLYYNDNAINVQLSLY